MGHVVVVGATGLVGLQTVATLRDAGQDPVGVARSTGVDVLSGDGLDGALTGADAVIDVTNTPETDPDKATEFFARSTKNLLAAEQRAGIGHHVLLSIVGIDR